VVGPLAAANPTLRLDEGDVMGDPDTPLWPALALLVVVLAGAILLLSALNATGTEPTSPPTQPTVVDPTVSWPTGHHNH
jgi:hypothetical protein